MFSFPLNKIEEMPKSNGVLAGINHSGIDTKSKVTDMSREGRTRKRSSQKSRKRWTLSIPVPTSLRLTFQSTSCTYELSLHFGFSFWVLSCWCFFMNANMSSWKRIKSTANNKNKTITCSNHWRVHKWSSPARCSRTYSIVIHFLVIRFVRLSLSFSLSKIAIKTLESSTQKARLTSPNLVWTTARHEAFEIFLKKRTTFGVVHSLFTQDFFHWLIPAVDTKIESPLAQQLMLELRLKPRDCLSSTVIIIPTTGE